MSVMVSVLAATSARAEVANTGFLPQFGSGDQGSWTAQSFTPASSNDIALPETVFLQSWIMVQPAAGATAALTTNRYLAIWDMAASNVVAVSTNAVTWTNGVGQSITPWRIPAAPLAATGLYKMIFLGTPPLVGATTEPAGVTSRFGGLFAGSNNYTGGSVFNPAVFNGDAWFHAAFTLASNALTDLDVPTGSGSVQSALLGELSGTAGLRKTGGGALLVDVTNTMSGDVMVEQGSLTILAGCGIGAGSIDLLPWGNQSAGTTGTVLELYTPGLFTNPIRGAGTLVAASTGTLSLGVANTFSGPTRIPSGALETVHELALQNSTLDLNVSDLGAFLPGTNTTVLLGGLTGGRPLPSTNALGQSLALTVGGNGRSNTYDGVWSGAGALTKAGTGVWTLTASNENTGGTTVQGGTIQIGNGGTTGFLPGPITNLATLVFNRSDGVLFEGPLSGSGILIKRGAGALKIGTDMAFTGPVTIAAGTLQLGDGGMAGSLDSVITNSAVLAINRASDLVFGRVISGTGSVVKSGAGTLHLAASNTYTGGTTILGGTVVYSNGAALGRGANTSGSSGYFAKPFTLRNGTVDLNGFHSYNPAAGSSTIIAPVVLFDGPLNFGGLAGGTMSFIDSTGTKGWGCGISNTLFYSAAGDPTGVVITARFIASGASGFTPRRFDIADSTNAAVEVELTGTLGSPSTNTDGRMTALLKTGPGTLKISNTNGFPLLRVLEGTLVAGHAQALGFNRTISGGSNNVVYVEGGVLDLGGFSPSIGALSDGGAAGGVIRNDGAAESTLTVGSANISTLFAGSIQNGLSPVGLTKTGSGTLTFTGVNTYTGTTTVTTGRLVLATNGALAGSALIVVDAAASLDASARTDGTLTLGPGQVLSGAGAVAGAVTNSGMVEPGAGIGALSLSNDFTQTASGRLAIEIATNGTAGTDHDLLLVTGPASLAGTLQALFTGGFTPIAGNTFTVLQASAVSGAFTTLDVAPVPGLSWQVQTNGGTVVLAAVAASSSPYEDWLALHGLAPNSDTGDADGDGFLNLLEYATGSIPTNNGSLAPLNAARASGTLKVSFTRNTNAVDATLLVEAGSAVTNGAEWTAVATNALGLWSGPATVVESGTGTPVTVTVDDTDPTATNRFLRLRVTRP